MTERRIKLAEVARLSYGKALPKRVRELGTVPVVSSAGVIDVHSTALVPGPGIVIGRKGNVGTVTYVDQAFWPIDTTFFVAQSDTELDLRYLAGLLSTLGLEGMDSHTGVPGLNRDRVEGLEVDVLPIASQVQVGKVLGALDRLISNVRRRIETMEMMARLIYQEWFVQFRFPGHADVELADSDLGPIPEGWLVRSVADILQLAYGKALKSDDRRGGSVPVYGSGGIVGWHDESLVSGPGIVVGRKGNVGAVYWSDGDFYPIDTTYFVRTEVPLSFVYQQLRTLEFIDSHAAVPGLSREQAYGLKVVVPADEILGRFDKAVTPMYELRRTLLSQVTVLERARDVLVPRLLSRELDVSDLDLDVKRVA